MARHNSRRSRPRYQWIRECGDVIQIPDTGTTVVDMGSITDVEITGEALAAPTLVRIRGEYLIATVPATATAGLVNRLAVGIIVVPSSVTVAEIGGPAAAPNLEWMYWACHAFQVPEEGAEDVAPGFVRVPFDVKAMRKIHKSSVRFIMENLGDSVLEFNGAMSKSCLFQE